MIYPNWILLSNKKQANDIYIYNMNESQRPYAEWKKPDSKEDVVLFTWHSGTGKINKWWQKADKWLPGAGKGEVSFNWGRVGYRVREMFLILFHRFVKHLLNLI